MTAAGFAAALVVQVPHGGGQGLLVAGSGRVDHLVDIARGLAKRAAAEGRSLELLDTRERVGLRKWRHAGVPIGSVRGGTLVLIVSDPRLSQREGQALAAWLAPQHVGSLHVDGGACTQLVRGLAGEFAADVVIVSLFAHVGMMQSLHVRSGGLLHTWRSPTDTVWGEVARHGAAFTLGELHLHPGGEILASLGMRTAALVGLENGHGLPVGALGVASAGELSMDVSHHLLSRAPDLGPRIMRELSSTPVPVADEDGSVDLHVLAARVGCRRFAVYRRVGEHRIDFAGAYAEDGSRLTSPPDPEELQVVEWAIQQGTGVAAADAAALVLGDDTVLYANDPLRRPLDRLRLALQDVRRNPFGGVEEADAA
ncbi:MAG: hypothetical protein ABI200_07405 [Gaiellales bacterium]